jgi:hypothetical protein
MIAEHATDEILYEEVQSFRQPWLWGVLLAVFLFVAVGFGRDLLSGPERARHAVVPAITFGLLWGGVCLFFFSLRLTLRVDHRNLYVRYFPLLRRTIPLEDIARWEARTYRPILEYGGWGLRYSWKGLAYNVSGNRGVQLVLADGKRVLLGSQRPDELAAAIHRAKGPGEVASLQ